MWLDNRPILTQWHGGPVTPTAILYELDGPAIFVSRAGPATLLFFKVAENEVADDFLVTQIDDNELQALRDGSLSIRGAMSHREAWITEVDFDFNVQRYQEQSYLEYRGLLPANGIPLYARHGEAADTLEQAQAFISFKFESDVMSSESMPLSVLKNRLDGVANLVRAALLPDRLNVGRKARFFDPEVAPLRFNSLLIAVKAPQFDEDGLLLSKDTAGFTSASLMTESEDKGATFVAELEETTNIALVDDLTRAQADAHFELLDSLVTIVPTSKNELNRLQIGFKTPQGKKFVSIDKRTGDRLVAARRSVVAPIRSINGVIIELNDDARTFIVKDASGRQTTINPLIERYKDMADRRLLRIGQRLGVTGRLWERTRRDLMTLTKDADPLV